MLPCCPQENSQKTVLFVTEKQPTSIATGWSEPVSVRELQPLKASAFSRRDFSSTPSVPPLDLPSLWRYGAHDADVSSKEA